MGDMDNMDDAGDMDDTDDMDMDFNLECRALFLIFSYSLSSCYMIV